MSPDNNNIHNMIRVQVGISLDETVTSEDLDDLLFVLGAPSVVSYLLFYRVNLVIKQVLREIIRDYCWVGPIPTVWSERANEQIRANLISFDIRL